MTKKTKKTKNTKGTVKGKSSLENHLNKMDELNDFQEGSRRRAAHDPRVAKSMQRAIYESSKQPKEGVGYLISPPQPPSKWVIDGVSDEAKEMVKKLAKEHKKKIGEIVNGLILRFDDTAWEVKALRLRNKQLLQEVNDLKTPWYKFWR